jgi:tight adherence protein C
MRQLAATVGGGTVGVASGAILFGSASGALGLLCCFAVAGATHHRGRLDRAIARRRRLMRSEVPTVAQLLAVHLRTGHGPIESVRRVGDRCRGPVGMELRGAVRSIADGSTPLQVYEQLAGQTSEPTVARLYRLLVSSARTGGDIVDPLLALSNEIRAAQRSDVARSAVKRRSAMVIPLLVLVAPVMTLFVASALPFIVFGAT